MKFSRIIDCCIALLAIVSCSSANKYDICVYGESASGVIASIQGARMGLKVALVSKNEHVGGMVTSGLTATDMNKHRTIGGVTAEFYGRIYDYYLNPDVWKYQTRDSFLVSTNKRTYRGRNEEREIQWVYESHVAEKIMRDMLEEAGVELIFNSRLPETGGVSKVDGKITEITLEDGKTITADMFIDASYEGDLMAQSGVSYFVGRESNEMYGETMNGIRVNYEPERDLSYIHPYKNGKLLPYVIPELWGKDGEADSKTQAYCYRVTLTDEKSNLVPITCPEGYNPDWYEILLAMITSKPGIELKNIITFTPMPNKKTDTNHLDFFGASFDYPEGSYATRETMEKLHRTYAIGMLWFLGHDERVPEYLRTEMLRWGFPKDEFIDTDHFPYQIYVREARRMQGEYIMTEQNVVKENRIPVEQSIGMGSYAIDCHFVSRVIDHEGLLRNEGTLFRPTAPYEISYYSLVPKRSECSNLLVTVCISASHVAYSSIRMEPNYMVMGQSAATAAALAIEDRCSVQDVDYNKLRKQLLADKQILSNPSNTKK